MELPATKQEKIKLTEINPYLTCYLCKGYLIDATTISECLHSFCRSCIIQFLHKNSYCPVCELIINKAKPNLKLDKTLQDIVYKLVPELFLREMLRRQTYYKDYPEIAARVSPEERGEDTERTIFNRQEMISLSLEYICDDSTPGAILIPEIATDPEALKNNGSTQEGQDSEMKRYLLCPGMCRIEVLKKFIRNKYNVDTNQFFIDVLYKRIPLPDHYTLIDIAYIYSWQRNELMKFFFRIIDKVKAKSADKPPSNPPQFIPRNFRRPKVNVERAKKETLSNKKSWKKSRILNNSSRHPNQNELHFETKLPNEEIKVQNQSTDVNVKPVASAEKEKEILVKADNKTKPKNEECGTKAQSKKAETDHNGKRNVIKQEYKTPNNETNKADKKSITETKVVPKSRLILLNNQKDKKQTSDIKDIYDFNETSPASPMMVPATIKREPISPEKLILKVSKEYLDDVNLAVTKPQVISKPVTKSYTSITLNRSENVEIITKIRPVSNKHGEPLGHHIIKQTIKKGSKVKSNSPKKLSGKAASLGIPRLVITKKSVKKKLKIDTASVKIEKPAQDIEAKPIIKIPPCFTDAKSEFFNSLSLLPKASSNESQEVKDPIKEASGSETTSQSDKQLIMSKPSGSQKRKNVSINKEENIKIRKFEDKKSMKIIVQAMSSQSSQVSASSDALASAKKEDELQSFISNCKIPSSLSITIKEGSEQDSLPVIVPPVNNYIEILKLPDESSSDKAKISSQLADVKGKEQTKLDLTKFCDNDSEQKVDQDLAEIAKSLTEKIPMSTTVSQIVGPKPQFQIPVNTNIPSKSPIQPSPVPELSKALTIGNPSKDGLGKLQPRSPQTFQKIFEESLRKPPESPKTSTAEVPATTTETPSSTPSNGTKRNILEIASQLFKKNKLELEQKVTNNVSLPKVPIPRLKPQKLLSPSNMAKMVPQTTATLHSTSLGLKYTVSVDQQSPSKVMKSNGIVSPIKADSVPGAPECIKAPVSPLTELKSVKTDFKVPSPSLGSPKLPEVQSNASSSPRLNTPSPKHSPKSSPLVKHMYAPTFSQRVPSPVIRSPNSQSIVKSPKASPTVPKSPKTSSPTSTFSTNDNSTSLNPNEILEKYNIQNLAQLTASFNLNPSILAGNQLAAFQQAMLFKHFEMQNRQNWLNRNQTPLLQYEKYLQSLNGSQNQT